MPEFERYPGESLAAARKRIAKNRMNKRVPTRMSPLVNARNNRRTPSIRRPGPGMAPPNTPPVRGGGPRRPGSGGSRVMNRPTMGNVIRGPKKRRGY